MSFQCVQMYPQYLGLAWGSLGPFVGSTAVLLSFWSSAFKPFTISGWVETKLTCSHGSKEMSKRHPILVHNVWKSPKIDPKLDFRHYLFECGLFWVIFKHCALCHIVTLWILKRCSITMDCSCSSYLCHFLPRGKVPCPHCFQSWESLAGSNLMDVILADVSPTGAIPTTPIMLWCWKLGLSHILEYNYNFKIRTLGLF